MVCGVDFFRRNPGACCRCYLSAAMDRAIWRGSLSVLGIITVFMHFTVLEKNHNVSKLRLKNEFEFIPVSS